MKDFLEKHLAGTLTVLFLFMSLIGFLYDYFLYKEFGFNIIPFSEPTDFFFSWLRDELLLIVSLPSLMLIIVDLLPTIEAKDMTEEKRKDRLFLIVILFSTSQFFMILFNNLIPELAWLIFIINIFTYSLFLYFIKSFIDKSIRIVPSFLVYLIFFLYLILTFQLFDFKDQEFIDINSSLPTHQVILKREKKENNTFSDIRLIGTNSRYHFFYDFNSTDILAVQNDDISTIRIIQPKESSIEDNNLTNQ